MNRYEEWIRRAKSNLELAQARLIPYVCYEDLCFNLQQSAEKAIKGFLIYYGEEDRPRLEREGWSFGPPADKNLSREQPCTSRETQGY